MMRKVSSTGCQRVLVSTHFAAGLATLLLTIPLAVFLNRTEPIGIALTTAVLGLVYGILFLIYRALGDAAAVLPDKARAGLWVPMISGIAIALAGIAWLVWVWLMGRPLTSLSTYVPLAVGSAGLWTVLALGSIVQARSMRKGAVRVAA